MFKVFIFKIKWENLGEMVIPCMQFRFVNFIFKYIKCISVVYIILITPLPFLEPFVICLCFYTIVLWKKIKFHGCEGENFPGIFPSLVSQVDACWAKWKCRDNYNFIIWGCRWRKEQENRQNVFNNGKMKSRTVSDRKRRGSGAKLLDCAGTKLAVWGLRSLSLMFSW